MLKSSHEAMSPVALCELWELTGFIFSQLEIQF